VAVAGLVEVSNLLTELEDLIDRSANEGAISTDERAANQLQIDSILASIDRIANTTEFQGKKLLSGELAYSTSAVSTTNIADVTVNAARIPNGSSRAVVVEVTQSAQQAALNYNGATIGASAVTLEVAGVFGSEIFSFAANANISAILDTINASSNLTGVTATQASATSLVFNSTGYGTSEFVTVRTLSGTFAVTGGDNGSNKDSGQDATVLINGTTAGAKGLNVSLRSNVLNLDLRLTETFGTALGSTNFDIVGGGADFVISPKITLAGMESLGIPSATSGNLGSFSTGFLASLKSGELNQVDKDEANFSTAQRIVREAQLQVSRLRGRLGAFQKNTLDATNNSLQVTFENTTAAESILRDTDFATETSKLTRQQILVQSATNVLRIANAQPQQALALLG
jgi:flagellin